MPEPLLRLPHRESRWVWEIDQARSRKMIMVTNVVFNGEEWWVTTITLPDAPVKFLGDLEIPQEHYNELDRFWEACAKSPIGGRLEDLSNAISPQQHKRQTAIQEELK